MDRPITWLVALTLALTACANACEDGPAAKRASGRRPGDTASSGKPDLAALEDVPSIGPKLPTIAWEDFTPFAPDSVGDYVAEAAAEGRIVKLKNGATLPTLKRTYVKDELRMEIELVDSTQAPMVRSVVEAMQDQDRGNDKSVFRGIVIHGHKGVIQWHPQTKAGRVGVVIEERYVVNVKISPTDSPDAAIAMLKKLDLEGFKTLKPRSPPAEATRAPPTTPEETRGPKAPQPAVAE